ncbi:immunity protein Tsi6 family protein [Duganella violaceipulchra]|uniref:Tsi6 domain-containing protein n=1 Tax=Duganella violaceipulchra TaxID=2849652 RepID=A0AA41HBW6_9BURK|nr:immunity protein Tsi6 family protein [Duganella violaceicalia]MBV6320918.1 hypothetical protein [Duganella violaceicalia]MCP2008370.1 hypothetical protein [Duganella violaceicalia]
MSAIETVTKALELARARLNTAPNFEIFSSAVTQLEYVLAVLNGNERDKSRLKNIIVGHFAVREFEESDPEFAEALMTVQALAAKMAKGLKV